MYLYSINSALFPVCPSLSSPTPIHTRIFTSFVSVSISTPLYSSHMYGLSKHVEPLV